MGLRLFNQKSASCFFVTTSFRNHTKSGNIPRVYEILAESIVNRLDKTQSKLIGYVLMPSHIHLLLMIDGDKLSAFMRDFKKFTSQKSLKRFRGGSSLWEAGYDRVAIWSERVLRTKLNYIHYNPVKVGLVDSPEDWKWSSAGDYINDISGSLPVWKGWV